MLITPEQAVRLVAAFVFVSYRVFDNVTSGDLKRHQTRSVELDVTPSPLGPAAMSAIWFLLYIGQTAFFYIFLESAVSYEHWSYVTAYVMFVCHVLVAKLWIGMFFKSQYFFGAFIISAFLFASAWAIFGIAIFGENVSAARFQIGMGIPLGIYGLWLLFPLSISYRWYMSERLEAASELRKTLVDKKNDRSPFSSSYAMRVWN